MRALLTICLFIATLGAGGAANASVLWQLHDFKFNDGATATGWFRWDTGANKAIEWNIATTAGTLAAYTYLQTNLQTNSSTYTTFAGDDITFFAGNRQLRLGIPNADALDTPSSHFVLAVPNVGQVGPYGFQECLNCSPYRTGLAGAFLSADAPPSNVPEPSTAALSVLALGVLAAMRRKA
jgi:hypothetical protein